MERMHTHQPNVPHAVYRNLSSEEETTFRQWARDNWKPNKEAELYWHPVVRDEWNKITEEEQAHEKSECI